MNRFAFIVHPIDLQDVIRFEPKAANKRLPLIEKMLEWMEPFEASHIKGLKSSTGEECEGWFLTCPFFPKQFLDFPRDKVYKKIIDTGKLAEKLGASILGLGAYTSIVGDAGITISKNLNIPVTSGNSLTIAMAIEGAVEAARLMRIDVKTCTASVLGATGAIGRACAYILSEQVGKLIIVARSAKRLNELASEIKEEKGARVICSTDVEESVNKSDIVISATTSLQGIIKPTYPRPGSVICDIALPHDVCREVATARPDVLIIEGGIVKVPGDVDFGYDFGYPPGVALACMSETMVLTLEGKFENYSLGRKISIEKVEEIYRLARKHGFELAGFRSFERSIAREEIEKIYLTACRISKNPEKDVPVDRSQE